MASSPAHSVPDTSLGLSHAELAILRQHQHIALSQAGSSRAASQASSQGLLLLDAPSLAALTHHFDRLHSGIQQRMLYVCPLNPPTPLYYNPNTDNTQLNQQTQQATLAQYDRSGAAIALADAEIARFRALLGQIDELDAELEKVRRVREMVKGMRARVEALERRVGR
ncbi:MAG: hypothetical protein M1829_000315 [Trizodia sp. TS-e1964]|nr:MAG: hypothetical protein M1829_000315 [Trizodia sp. TS-e1964]